MKRIVTVSSVLLILISCASPPVSGPDLTPEPTRKSVSNIPDWYLNTPSESGYRFETGTATSQDLQLAVNKASLDAQTRLAATIESEMEGYTKRVQEETGLGAESNILDRYSQTQSQVVATTLKDYTVDRKEIIEEDLKKFKFDRKLYYSKKGEIKDERQTRHRPQWQPRRNRACLSLGLGSSGLLRRELYRPRHQL